jgi:hypothetical protein
MVVAMSAVATENRRMGRKRKPRTGDRHAGNWPVRIPLQLAELLETLGKRNVTNAATEARRLIREGLQREGLFPIHPTHPKES